MYIDISMCRIFTEVSLLKHLKRYLIYVILEDYIVIFPFQSSGLVLLTMTSYSQVTIVR